ncbi:hypothetical protein GE061_000494 [Apolygus lucorum]|uniref:Uncharacterized protein n=1 Tax=Apolygus lucorum TaxID=248454 RepID=A0A6A4K471_APOLU|nr:hypothetical protein GE061_000494 [Apolygus lucorum]
MAFRLLVRSSSRLAVPHSNELALAPKLPVANFHVRLISSHSINKNICLISQDGFLDKKPFKIFKDETKPIVIMLPWLLARKKHVMKYCDVYLKNGFNVMTVSVTPWQFFWPITGTQVVAEQLLQYLEGQTERQQKLILHGFSVGAYLWGEVLVRMNADLPKYQELIRNIKGQVWDSAAEVTETSKGLPTAMFPRNAFLRSTMEKYVNYHLNTFYDAATQHYLRASQLFHTTPVHAPSLVLVAKNDPIGSVVANQRCKESWESIGMKVYWQCWDKSRHVSHLMLHKELYLKTLYGFLNDVLESEESAPLKMKAKV